MAERPIATLRLTEGMAFEAEDRAGHRFLLDSRPDQGGAGLGFSPTVALLVAGAACHAMDVLSLLRKMRQDVAAYRLEAGGERAEEHPRFYVSVFYEHILEGEVDGDALRRAIELSITSYCPVSATLRALAPITCRYQVVASGVQGEMTYPATHAAIDEDPAC
jgi:putative redox protein